MKKIFVLHCGGYRSFRMLANNPKNAVQRFAGLHKRDIMATKGFSAKDITHITETNETAFD